MFFTESEITSDFDQLSLLSGDTPKEKITGYSLSSPVKRGNSLEQSPPQTIDQTMTYPTYGNEFSSSTCSTQPVIQHSSVKVLGKGRGNIIYPQIANHVRIEPLVELEKDLRVVNPGGYKNGDIELNFAHHLKETPPHEDRSHQPTSLVMSEVPVPSKNVALLSLNRIARKSGKKYVTSNSLEMNDKNFPILK